MTTAHEALAAYWREKGDKPTRFVNPEVSINYVERLYGIKFPEDFRAYVLHAAPMDDFWDDGDVTWWSPTNLKNIPDEYGSQLSDAEISSVAVKCIFFADFLIWCWAWAICCDEGEHYGKIAFIGEPDCWVAPSFSAFVSDYLNDPKCVSGPPDR